VLFLIPWLTIFPAKSFRGLFPEAVLRSMPQFSYGLLFASVITFSVIILVAYIYAWGKGVLKWD
jgi:NADH:ubiquinone oxidoreductase subunit 3 (subunit A)